MSDPESDARERHGGQLVGAVLARQGVRFLFTLCGGHISPILIGAEEHGLRVIDVRHEATAVFAADAMARLSGTVGVAAVTAGPGLTNTITAVKNAQIAQTPVVILGGATAGILKGRGSLQDIDQMALMRPHVKWANTVNRVRDIVPSLEKAFRIAQEGVPGPVFLEYPIDTLYPESMARAQLKGASSGRGLASQLQTVYINRYLDQKFGAGWEKTPGEMVTVRSLPPTEGNVEQVMDLLAKAERPVFVVGSQALQMPAEANALQEALIKLGVPTYLSGMARGLLGRHKLHMRHQRSKALREADLILLAGVPADFRLNYGRAIPRQAIYINVNRSAITIKKNRKPDLGIHADPGTFLRLLASRWAGGSGWPSWLAQLMALQDERDADIAVRAAAETEYVNPVRLCEQLETHIAADSVIIGDGGDFVATASYILRPRAPLTWLDPGAFGTLGVGAGFALAAKLHRPEAEVWILFGDGAVGYSLAEFDTLARHGIAIIGVIGNDAAWAQIARDQVEWFGTSLGTDLARPDYEAVATALGGHGILVQAPDQVAAALGAAKEAAATGKAVLLNIQVGRTDFRKGSISI